MKEEWNDTIKIVDSIEIDNCSIADSVLSPIFRKYSVYNEKILSIYIEIIKYYIYSNCDVSK